MKKTFLLIGCMVVLALGIISISCKKEESKNEDSKNKVVCTCTFKYEGNVSDPVDATQNDLKEAGAKSCNEFAVKAIEEMKGMSEEELDELLGGLPLGFDINKLQLTCKDKK